MINKIKYIFLSVLLSSWSSFVWAQAPQPNYTLTTNETGAAKSYVAREYVSLKPGFAYSASGGGSFNAKIDQTLIFPPTANTYAKPDGTITTDPTQGAVVGSIPGQFGVSPTGAANYTIPIECPAGVNGMQPNISLTYNSQGGSGIAGYGWSVSGISAIGKSMKNIFSDDAISGIDLSKREKYTLDGNALLSLVGDYGSDGATYKTENKTYSVITSIGQKSVLIDPVSTTNLSYTSYPLSFKVTTKDGQVLEYGSSNFDRIIPVNYRSGSQTVYSSQPFQWLISKTTDANGNSMTFSYLPESGIVPTIKSIKYSDISIEYDYDIKQKIQKAFINGYSISDKYLLRHIRVVSGGATIKQYDLNYNYDSQKGKYFLMSVTLTGQDNIKLNPTTIEWGANNTITSVNSASIPNPSNYYSEESKRTFAANDIDGDGISELVEFFHRDDYSYRSNSGYNIYNSADYARVSKMTGDNGRVSYGGSQSTYPIGGTFSFDDFKSLNGGGLFADFNGDGTKSIIVPTYMEMNGQTFIKINDVKSNVQYAQPLKYSNVLPAYAVADINNDGVDEIISMERRYPSRRGGPRGTIVYIKKIDNSKELSELDKISTSDFDYQLNARTDGEDPTSGMTNNIYIADFDGDGLKDIMETTEVGCFFMKNNGGAKVDGVTKVTFTDIAYIQNFNSTYSTIRTGDFNGDGLMDFIVNEHCNSNWKLAINNGRWGFDFTALPIFTAVEESFTGKNDDKEDCIVTDFNHDGKSDVLLINPVYDKKKNIFTSWGEFQYTDAIWYSSTGNGFVIDHTARSSDEDYTYSRYNTQGDFDGDGREEVFSYGSDFYSCSSSAKNLGNFHSSFNFQFGANQLKSITDGMGVKTEVAYQPLTYSRTLDNTKDFYTKGTGSVYPIADITAPIYSVQKVTQPIGDGNFSTTEYAYSGAKVQLTGKGFLGFSSQTVSNVVNNTQVITSTEIDNTLCLPTKQTSITSAITDGGEISRSESTFANSKDADKVYLSVPETTTETNSLNGLTKKTEYILYDAYGNLKETKTTQGDLTTTQSIDYGQFGSWAWCPNKPISSISKSTLVGNPDIYTRKKTYDYNSTSGNLTTEIIDPEDTENKLTTTYSEFDTWGHPQTISVETPNRTARTSHVKYTSSGRFIESKTNNLGETTSFKWNETRGVLDSETDNLSRTTTYTYNGLGQSTGSVFPNGIRSASTVQWAGESDSAPAGARYRTYNETSGTAPTVVWYDGLGRELAKETKGLKGNKISVFTKYLSNGKVDRISEPTFELSVNNIADNKWASKYSYEKTYGRVNSVITPTGETKTEYLDAERKVKVTSPDAITITELNSTGQTLSSSVNGKVVTYTYHPSGLTKTSTPAGGKSLQMYYDLQGNRVKLVDPDAGIVESKYNGFGELLWEQQKVHNKDQYVKTTNNYYDNGLLSNIVREGKVTETTVYTYDTDPKHPGRIKSINIEGKNKQTFSYDDWSRVTNVEEIIGSRVFNRQTQYDVLGRVKKEIYPSGYAVTNSYDNYSNLIEVKDNANNSIWLAIDENAKGQIRHDSRRGKVTTYEFYDNGLPREIKADGIVDMYYEFDDKNNLYSREDKLAQQKEQFHYDVLNRLDRWTVTNNGIDTPFSMEYDDAGNILRKSDLGNFDMKYGVVNNEATVNQNPGPHALTSIAPNPGTTGLPSNFPSANLNVTYTDFKKIATLKEGTKEYYLSYGVDDQRRKSEYYMGGVLQQTRYYVGDYEEETDVAGNVRKIHYLSGGAMMVSTGGVETLYYRYADYQGSLIALTDANGDIVQKFAYDPWGARRDPANWTQKDSRTSWLINRGYTGHEHLDAFGIINMNGRVYDPLTAQFFSPDPYVQTPDNWLNYNRYTYCYGNPFKYTDPSGELQIGPFYLSLNLGWSKNGGFSFGISAGVGLENTASVGISLGFGSSGNFSVSLNGNLGGGYAYAGFDTKGGFIAGAGVSVISPFSMWSPISINSNMFSIGADYSSNGGFSGNYLGMSISSAGMSFNPSIGVSATMKWGDAGSFIGDEYIPLDANDKSGEPSIAYGDEAGINKQADQWFKKQRDLTTIHANGKGGVGKTSDGKYCFGRTRYTGFKSTIYLAEGAYKSNAFLFMILQHEYAHVFMNNHGYSDYEDAQEVAAYTISAKQAYEWGMTSYANKFNEYKQTFYNNQVNANPGYTPMVIPISNLNSTLKHIIP